MPLPEEFVDRYLAPPKQPLAFYPEIRHFTNPNRVQFPEASALACKLGQKLERVALKIWEKEQCRSDSLQESAQQVREKLAYVAQHNIFTAREISPHYQALTQLSELPFLGDERTEPDEPLRSLFSELDSLYEVGLTKLYTQIGTNDAGHLRFLVEAALTMARLNNEPRPFGNDVRIIPDVRIGNKVQFDGLLVPSDNPGRSVDEIMSRPWSFLEIKFDTRARNISGTGGQVSRRVYTHHLRELLQRTGTVVTAQEEVELPESAVVMYLRGTLPHAVHIVSFNCNYALLSRWRLGLELAKERLKPDKDGSKLNAIYECLIQNINQRIEELDLVASRQQRFTWAREGGEQLRLIED